MSVPSGWRKSLITENEYEAILIDGQYKYEINVNVQTGQRQIYSIDPFFRTREFIGTINNNGSTIRQEAWTTISNQPNGQSRLKRIIDSSRIAANVLVEKVGTESQIKTLQETKEFSKLKEKNPSPTSPGSGEDDEAGANAGGDNERAGSGATPSTQIADFRNVSTFQSEDDKYGNWIYPKSLNLTQDYLIISTYNYQVADVFGGDSGISNINSDLIFGGANLSKRTLKNNLGTVTLPMPTSISEANQTGWGEDSLNNLAAGLMGGAVGVVGKIADADLIGGGADVINTAKNIFGKAGAKAQIKQQLTLNTAASVVKKLGININPESYRARVTGTVINPNLELLFNGPKLRSFQFSYKLTPRSAEEAREIRGIIKFFKKSMAPKRAKTGGTGDEFFLGAPNIFRLKFMSGSNPSNKLPTLKTCALVNFNVNYTADGFYSAFHDGQPISVQIDLAFAELTPIYNDNYGSDDSVGFIGGVDGLDDLENPLFDPSDKKDTDVSDGVNPTDPGPSGQRTSPAQTLIQPTERFQPQLGLPGVESPFDSTRDINGFLIKERLF